MHQHQHVYSTTGIWDTEANLTQLAQLEVRRARCKQAAELDKHMRNQAQFYREIGATLPRSEKLAQALKATGLNVKAEDVEQSAARLGLYLPNFNPRSEF